MLSFSLSSLSPFLFLVFIAVAGLAKTSWGPTKLGKTTTKTSQSGNQGDTAGKLAAYRYFHAAS